MQCRHCLTEFHANPYYNSIDFYGQPKSKSGDNVQYSYTSYVCPKCHGVQVDLKWSRTTVGAPVTLASSYPAGGLFPPPPEQVPSNIAADYSEANEVLRISPKASAALSRRCLQAILWDAGYKSKNLAHQVDEALNETAAAMALPIAIRENFDAIRHFGNFSAHPLTDASTLQIIDVEPGEAEWCLEILIQLFEHYYVAPAIAAAKRAALSAKLQAAGKPPMKGN